jgi:hypothetical protein
MSWPVAVGMPRAFSAAAMACDACHLPRQLAGARSEPARLRATMQHKLVREARRVDGRLGGVLRRGCLSVLRPAEALPIAPPASPVMTQGTDAMASLNTRPPRTAAIGRSWTMPGGLGSRSAAFFHRTHPSKLPRESGALAYSCGVGNHPE